MLKIRKEQREVLSQYMHKQFNAAVETDLKKRYPEQIELMSGEQLSEFIDHGVEDAKVYGITDENDVKRFMGCFAEYGREFGRSPETKWAEQFLNDNDLTGTQKMDKIGEYELLEMNNLKKAMAERINRNAKDPLTKYAATLANKEQRDVLSQHMPEQFNAAMVTELKKLYPEQIELMSGEQLSEFIAHGVEDAKGYGITDENDVKRFMGYFSEYGSEFGRSPETKWAEQFLKNNDLTGTQKLDKIDEYALSEMGNLKKDMVELINRKAKEPLNRYAVSLVNKEKGEVLSQYMPEQFNAAMETHLKKGYPELIESMSGEQLSGFIAQGVEDAKAYGITAENDVKRYMGCLAEYGRDFGRSSETKWAEQFLKNNDLTGTQKMDRIEDYALSEMNNLKKVMAEGIDRKVKKPVNKYALSLANKEQASCNCYDECKKWMDAYVSAGGLWEWADPKGKKPDDVCISCPGKRRWIEIELFDEENNPLSGEECKIEFPDGSVVTGKTDRDGVARVSAVDFGNCEVSFAKLDKDAWYKI